jgi:hypothetical protein
MALPVLRSKDFVHQPRFQLWTDALCFREMAKQAPNNYLRSMCVRNWFLPRGQLWRWLVAMRSASTNSAMIFDEAKGWPIGGSFGFATLTAVGADPNDPNTLQIALVTEDGAEKVTNTFSGRNSGGGCVRTR